MPRHPRSIVVVGAGPRGTGLLERLGANLPELLPDGELDVHLVDPFPPGAGRIWRHAQSPLLAMNSMAADVTMYTDDSVVCAGPIVAGPSLWDWVQRVRDGELPTETADALGPALWAELTAVDASTFPSRQLQSRYLEWVLRDVVAALPPRVRVHLHTGRATAVTETGEDQWVTVEGLAAPIRADSVVLASGHLDATPTVDELDLGARAAAAGLRYLPPEQTTDTDLSVVRPGETVLVRGLGLAFVDLVVLLFEGRGGRFVPAADSSDQLRYIPSGDEPVLVAGSPRGSIYHSKTHYQLRGGRPPLPRHFGPADIAPLVAGGPVDMGATLWPLMAKEIAWGWYHELVAGHPDRVTLDLDEFAARFAALRWGTAEMDAFLADAAPDPLDRLDLDALDRPLAGLAAPDLDALQPLVVDRIAEDLRQHVDPRHTPHLGAFVAMLSVYGEVTQLQGEGGLTAASRARDVPWWQSFFNAVASGPPGFRVRQILALADAGLVRFLGPGMWVSVEGGVLRAGSAATPEIVTSTILVDARLPDSSAARSTDPLLAQLVRDGAVSEEILYADDGTVLRNTGLIRVRPADGALVDARGAVHPRRFAVGPHTAVKVAGAFTRPGMNAQSLRYNDAIARAVLASLPAESAAAA
ncbi:FAD/NAD(P)-binding domain-containing protein [Pseudonocardia sp. N23]|uniref:FAD/NAD(P)-binding protein n=1 Tax=Pseudonocardia sp. N23 TaxID=1987376 RepID=UPI000BFE4297|nr:FAD/NAD(P)-binding protein [Pseudonocardia sp. N23]GAY08552.1 nitrogen regulatory protein P-II [Pseudonocardia sp. N23]